jgi:predicted nuclease of restriction endonuclease-like (RecB) superfamily
MEKSHTQNEVYQNIREIILTARHGIKKTVEFSMVQAYWQIGRQIMDAQGGENRAEYGTQLLKFLAEKLTHEFGVSFSTQNLRNMRQFYLTFQNCYTLCSELSWSHYRLIMRISNVNEREFYIKECAQCNWSARQLERQINSLYHKRLLASTDKDSVRSEIQELEPKESKDYILKDPYVLEFLELKENKNHHEKEIEQALLDNLQEFLLELGKGFSFVGRQRRITLDGDHFYIDLVFYNFILRCFVVIDLKAGKLAHQDIGQLDFYVRYFDDKVRQAGDNPTIGLILCADKNESVAKYSVLSDNKNLFASKYLTCLPTELELKAIIDEVKAITAESKKTKNP